MATRPINNNETSQGIEQNESEDTDTPTSSFSVTSSNLSVSSDQTTNILDNRKNCSCSKILIMQLFHEMKQIFPKVPDHVVHQSVHNNCHERDKLLDELKNLSIDYPGSAQAYPSQSLRNASANATKVKPIGNITKSIQGNIVNGDLNSKPKYLSSDKKEINKQLNTNSSDMNKPHVPQRPTTLSLASMTQSIESKSFGPNVMNDTIKKGVSRPVRLAPPPPTSTSSPTSGPTDSQTSQDSQSSDTLNLSLNVSVSPVTGKQPVRPPTRHVSAISMNPDPVYLQQITQPQRSFTSVNFTLRNPTPGGQTPINITALPGNTYSSTSYDARQGYQSRLEITVGNDNSTAVSAMRARSRTGYNPFNVPDSIEEGSVGGKSSNLASSVIWDGNPPSTFNKKESEVIKKQLKSKLLMSREVEDNRFRLESLQREVMILQRPIPSGFAERLEEEIKEITLRCERLANVLEGPINSDVKRSPNEVHYENVIISPNRPPANIVNVLSGNRNASALTSMSEQLAHGDPRHFGSGSAIVYPADYNQANEGDRPWTCSICTMLNHPDLTTCEMCGMIPSGKVQVTATKYEPHGQSVSQPTLGAALTSSLAASSMPIIPNAISSPYPPNPSYAFTQSMYGNQSAGVNQLTSQNYQYRPDPNSSPSQSQSQSRSLFNLSNPSNYPS